MKSRFLGINIALILAILLILSHFLFTSVFVSQNQTEVRAADEIFYRNLGLGSTGQDVLLLQRLLNTDSRFAVAISGPGSPGQETTSYGLLTRDAVAKFQALHDPLPPPGYTPTYTGYVDDKTRAGLNEYALSINFDSRGFVPPTPEMARNELNNEYKRANITVIPGFPYIDTILPGKVKNGEMITIYGRNFSTTTANIVHMTYNDVYATSTDGVTLRVQVKSYLNELFDKQTRNLDSDDRAEVVRMIPDIPIFIFIQTENKTSNPYMIYFNIK